MPVKTITIRREDIERVVGQMPENTSLARKYFGAGKMKNSTHISVTSLKKEYGNVPVIMRGDTGIVPKHGMDVTDIVPMPIEIDDKLRATEMDEYERASEEGKQQIIDEYLNDHAIMVRETTNALCCQAHRGKIDYMMKAGAELIRYQVNYGEAKNLTFGKSLSSSTMGDVTRMLSQLKSVITKNGIGGAVEFIAHPAVYSHLTDLLTAAKNTQSIREDHVLIGPYKVMEDVDSYVDVTPDGTKTTKSLCENGEICCRAVNAGQKLVYLRLDDVVQREAVPIYSFTETGSGQRGMNLYTKSKPFPLINTKGIAFGKFKEETFAITFTAGPNGTVTAQVDGKTITSGDKIAAGKTVTFTASPSASHEVDAWTGVTTSSGNSATLEVTEAATVNVTFKTTT